MVWGRTLLGRTKEGSVPFAVLGILVPQGSFPALLLKCGWVFRGQLLEERPPNMEKQAVVFEKAARVRCCACPPWRCGICSAVGACASPVILQAWEGETDTAKQAMNIIHYPDFVGGLRSSSAVRE